MDIALEINNRIKELEVHASISGIIAASKHIHLAESHYKRGITDEAFDNFNDVIYRCNQAFEGMLKEAYLIITSTTDRKISPYIIESYFNNNSVLKPRVMELIKNYRQDWRNTSTHDHTVEFNADEAMIAISNVSSFAFILLGNILEFENQKVGAKIAEDLDSAVIDTGETLFVAMKNAILKFSEIMSPPLSKEKTIRVESTLLGFLKSRFPDVDFSEEVSMSIHGYEYRPDILARRGQESVIVDISHVKNPPTADKLEDEEIFGFGSLIDDVGVNAGIRFIRGISTGKKLNTTISTGLMSNRIDLAFIVSK